MEGINIYSGSKGLGAALTNPTELAHKKGAIKKHYPVEFRGAMYPDAETAYQTVKRSGPWLSEEQRESLMTEIIIAKLQQHPDLREAIKQKGGVEWLKSCSHKTGYGTDMWQGEGKNSAMIRCLILAYLRA